MGFLIESLHLKTLNRLKPNKYIEAIKPNKCCKFEGVEAAEPRKIRQKIRNRPPSPNLHKKKIQTHTNMLENLIFQPLKIFTTVYQEDRKIKKEEVEAYPKLTRKKEERWGEYIWDA